MSEIQDLTQKIIQFRNERDWEQFHKPKDLAISLSLEAGEVLEHFQWKTEVEIAEYLKTHKEYIADELGDVMNYLLLLSHAAGVDIVQAAANKIKKNAEKYPVDKAKGRHTKYNKL